MTAWADGPLRRRKKKEMILLSESNGFINRMRWQGGIYRTNLSDFGDAIEVENWIYDNLSSKTELISGNTGGNRKIFFKTQEDVVAFKLRWM